MFYQATAFNKDIGKWNTSNVTGMSVMFYGATSFNQDIESWNTSNVNLMTNMFNGASKFNQDLSKWDVKKVNTQTGFTNIFKDTNISEENYCKASKTWNKGNLGKNYTCN